MGNTLAGTFGVSSDRRIDVKIEDSSAAIMTKYVEVKAGNLDKKHLVEIGLSTLDGE